MEPDACIAPFATSATVFTAVAVAASTLLVVLVLLVSITTPLAVVEAEAMEREGVVLLVPLATTKAGVVLLTA